MLKNKLFTTVLLALGLFLGGMAAQAQEYSVKLTTSKAVGSEVVFLVNDTYEGITVDWGDGELQTYKSDGDVCEIKGAVKGAVITLSGPKSWDMLVCADARLTEIDLSSAKQLHSLYCQNNALTGLDLRGMTGLTDLNCSNNAITKLTFTSPATPEKDLASIETINVSGNKLSGGFTVRAASLKYVDISNNAYTSILTSSLNNLDYLKCDNNKLVSLSLSNSKGVSTLVCHDNQIKSIIINASATALQQMVCDNNMLKGTLNLSNMVGLKDFSCANNDYSTVFLARKAQLFTLNTSNNVMDFRVIPRKANRPDYLSFMPQRPYDISGLTNVKKASGIPYIEVVTDWADRKEESMVLNLDAQARLGASPDDAGAIEGTIKWYGVDIDGNVTELVARTAEDKEGDYYLLNRQTAFFTPQRQVYAVVTATRNYTNDNLSFQTTPISVGQEQATGIESMLTPDTDALHISASRGQLSFSAPQRTAVRIFSADGKQVWSGTVDSPTTVALPAGIYIVNGKKVAL